MGTDFSTFKELTPEARIRELQKLIDDLKKEIEDRQNEIKTAEQMIAVSIEEARVLEQVAVPEAPKEKTKKTTKEEGIVQKLEEKEGKRLTKQEQLELEKLLATAPPRSEELFNRIAHRPINELYSELRNIYERERQTGIETAKDREMIYAIRRGLEEKKKDIQEGEYSPAKTAKHLLTAAEQMAENMYQGSGAGTYKRN